MDESLSTIKFFNKHAFVFWIVWWISVATTCGMLYFYAVNDMTAGKIIAAIWFAMETILATEMNSEV